MKVCKVFTLTLVLMTGISIVNFKAEAANRYAQACITNKTKATIYYKTRWGDGPWKDISIYPGKRRWHSWRYREADHNRSPHLRVRFDSDLSGDRYWQTYKLEKNATPQEGDCQRYGVEYVFKYDGSSRDYIDLKKLRR